MLEAEVEIAEQVGRRAQRASIHVEITDRSSASNFKAFQFCIPLQFLHLMKPISNALNIIRRPPSSALRISCRYISLTGAIERGLRQGKRSVEDKHEPYRRPARFAPRQPRDNERTPDALGEQRQHEDDESGDQDTRAPRTIPFSTASSEFIYGTFAVNAALKARRRKLYKLYILAGQREVDGIGSSALKRRAESAGVEVRDVSGHEWKLLFERAADGRPHNGFILEASPIPVLPVTSLQEAQLAGHPAGVNVGHLTPEDEAVSKAFNVASLFAEIPLRGRQKRFPIFLLLDRVTDLGNLGAIIRSAYYFGVNAIVLLDHGTAPLSGVTVKASAGAAELMPILRIRDETSFINTSKSNGWHLVAAISPEDVPLRSGLDLIPEYDAADGGLDKGPVVLMLGNEAEGLRPRLAKMCSSHLTIQDAVSQHSGVDSLNVSVAAGILMHDLLRPFLGKNRPSDR